MSTTNFTNLTQVQLFPPCGTKNPLYYTVGGRTSYSENGFQELEVAVTTDNNVVTSVYVTCRYEDGHVTKNLYIGPWALVLQPQS